MNMVKAEFYKLRKSKPFWVLLLICALMAAVLPFALQQAVASGEPEVQGISLSAVDMLCYSFGMPLLTLAAAIFTSIFVSGEFHHGTMKNHVSKGFSRHKILLSKYLACAAAVTAMLAVYIPVVLISGTIFFGFDPQGIFRAATFIQMLLVLWLLIMAYTAVFVATGMSLRSNGASIATNICLVSIFPTLLGALDFLLGSFGIKISKLWIEASVSAVASMKPAAGALVTGIVVGFVWLLAAGIGGTMLFQRQDIK